jgi:Beta-propeller repeat
MRPAFRAAGNWFKSFDTVNKCDKSRIKTRPQYPTLESHRRVKREEPNGGNQTVQTEITQSFATTRRKQFKEARMKQRDEVTNAGNKKKSQRRGDKTMARLQSKIFVVSATILVQLLVVLTFATTLLAQELFWVKSPTGNGQGFGIAVDLSGNSYVTGGLAGNVFVAKYDNTGNLVWASSAGGVGTGQGIAIDGSGNSYVTGELGGSDLFLAKYNATGSQVWLKRVTGTGEDCSAISQSSCLVGKGIGVDGSGNSYVAGRFQVTATKPTIILV